MAEQANGNWDRRKAVSQMERARRIARSLGYRTAAHYLRKRGWSLQGALHILCNR